MRLLIHKLDKCRFIFICFDRLLWSYCLWWTGGDNGNATLLEDPDVKPRPREEVSAIN